MSKNSDHSFRQGNPDNWLNVEVKLSVIVFEEDGLHFVYSPELDITGYGKTESEAKQSYHLAMEEFLSYTSNKGTLFKELESLGWRI